MLQSEPSQPPAGRASVQTVARPGAAPGDQQPIRFLLLRQKAGELPWLVRALIDYMAPAQVVPVIGLTNALWRLGRERFDAVLLDIQVTDPSVLERCREHIADVAAVPVLHLYETARQAKAVEQRPRPHLEFSRTAASPDRHEVARLPWERRAKREARKAKQASASVA
jgi:DNA-binding NtrC family response regulator